jgi:hypothetical protein
MHTKFWWGNANGIDHSDDLSVDGRTILEWILGEGGGKVCSRRMWLTKGAVAGCL